MKNLEHLVTADQLLAMERGRVCHELIRGEVREMPPPGAEHGAVTLNIQAPLYNFVREHQLGRVFAAETGFLIERDPDTVRAPDCAFVRAERLAGGVPKKYCPFAPDLAVETELPDDSPDDRPRRLEDKVKQWLDCGARLVWVIDPARRTVTVHSPNGEPRTLRDQDLLGGEDVVPGFRMAIADLWQ